MIQAMYSGISGMKAFKGALDVIGNNIANINTTSYKAGRASFKDMLSQTISGATAPSANRGGVNASQVGLGVTLGSIDQNMTGGSMQSTSRASDLAIEGNGYFILGDGSSVSYTRDGSFSTDAEFNMVASGSGKRVLGWAADFNTGIIDTSVPITSDSVLNIPIGGLSVARATSKIDLAGNLDASSQAPAQTTSARITGNLDDRLGPAGSSLATLTGSLNSAAATGDTHAINFNVYDVAGTSHPLTVTFTKNAAAHVWDYAVTSTDLPALSITGQTDFDAASGVCSDTSLSLGVINWGASTTDMDFNTSTLTEAAAASNATMSSVDGLAPSAPVTMAFNIYDSLGTAHPVTATFTKQPAADTWAYTVTSADGAISGLPAGQTLTFTSAGVSNSASIPVTLTLTTANGSDSPIAFSLDTSVLRQDQAPTTAAMSSQNGSAPGDTVEIKYDIYDSLGLTHKMRVLFDKTSDPATWDYHVVCDDATTASLPPAGQITFNSLGYSQLASIPISLSLQNPNGSTDPLVATIDTQNISQLNGKTTVDLTYQDGLQLGTLESFGVGKDGVITGTFTNGSSRSLGKVALAQFNNAAGLTKVGNNSYAESPNSGTAKIGEAGTGGLGAINSNFLEASNVDLATEFANMIVAQRGFQATSKIITTSDEILQELVNLKR